MPEPDIAWVREGSYVTGRPEADDALLIIEVGKSSLLVDLGNKALLYADAGIADYWVANIETKVLMVHRNPKAGKYRSIVTHQGKGYLSYY